MATRWKTCVDLRANLILTKVNASHRKSTQVHASPGQTKSQAGPSLQLASTCVSVWPGLKAKLKACYNYSVFLFRMLDPTPTPPPLLSSRNTPGLVSQKVGFRVVLALQFIFFTFLLFWLIISLVDLTLATFIECGLLQFLVSQLKATCRKLRIHQNIKIFMQWPTQFYALKLVITRAQSTNQIGFMLGRMIFCAHI